MEKIKLLVEKESFTCCNIIDVWVGSNCPAGGDSGHGGRTVFGIEDQGGTDLRISLNGEDPIDIESFEIILGGDSECATFIDALKFALKNLESRNVITQDKIGAETEVRFYE